MCSAASRSIPFPLDRADASELCGSTDQARELAIKTARLLARGLAQEGALRECYDDSGRGLWPRTGTFISWNVLALTLLREHWPEATVTWR